MAQNRSGQVRVWDPVVRIFHWTLVLSFLVAWVTEDDLMTPHVWAGYLITALLAIRRHARQCGWQYAAHHLVAT